MMTMIVIHHIGRPRRNRATHAIPRFQHIATLTCLPILASSIIHDHGRNNNDRDRDLYNDRESS
jgi:hypothetical protein